MAVLLSVVLSVLAVAPTGAPAEVPTDGDVQKSVARALPYLEREGAAWISERNCNSCHVVAFMVWSHNEAKAGGVKVDAKKLDEWTAWALDYSTNARQWFKLTDESLKQLKAANAPDSILAKLKAIANKPFVTESDFLAAVGKALDADELTAHKPALLKAAKMGRTAEKNDGGSMATMGQLLLGRTGSTNPRVTPFLEAAPGTMRAWQEANGSWKATGQLFRQNRPGAENDEVTTGWGLLGLASLDKPDEATKKSIEAALAFFRKAKPGKSHEQLLVRMMVEHKFGKPPATAELLREVLSKQNADGGWAWLPGGPSDAFATGQTLYALNVVGAGKEEAIRKGQKYLLSTQTADGFWDVPPKGISDQKATEDRVRKVVAIYDYWGTAWAVIGLSRTLPTAK